MHHYESQINLPHGTKNKENRDAQKKRSSHDVRGVSPEAERESMVGKICERGIGLESGVKE